MQANTEVAQRLNINPISFINVECYWNESIGYPNCYLFGEAGIAIDCVK